MREVKKLFTRAAGVLGLALVVFGLLSCEGITIGLGNKTDTDTPSIKITYPPTNANTKAVIRDTFVLAGTCSDDIGVKSVEVSLNGGVTESVVFTGNAEISSDKKSWRINVNKIDAATGIWEIKDGNYTVTATAKDDAGHYSSHSAEIVIDNTAPVLILQTPNEIGNSEKNVSYGRRIKFTGDVADSNKKYLDFYYAEADKYGNVTGETKVIKNFNVTNGMNSDTPLVIAQYRDDLNDNSPKSHKDQYDNFIDIYGEVGDSNVEKYYRAGVVLYDNAKIYQNPDESVNNSIGNKSERYYIKSDSLNDYLNENNLKDFSADNLLHIINHTYDENSSEYIMYSPVLEELNKSGNFVEFKDVDKVSSAMNKFNVNPDDFPSWGINSYAIAAKDSEEYNDENHENGYRVYSAGNPLVLTITPNTNKDLVNPSKITLKYHDILTEDAPWITVFDEGDWQEAVSDSALTYTFDIKNAESAHLYEFDLYGEDNSGNDYSCADDSGYGFIVYEDIAAPVVRIDNLEKVKYYSTEIEKGVKISGTVKASAGIFATDPMKAKISVTDKNGNELKKEDLVVEYDLSKGTWAVEIPNYRFVDGNYKYTLSVNATVKNSTGSAEISSDDVSTEIEVIVDTTAPVFDKIRAGNNDLPFEGKLGSDTIQLTVEVSDAVSGIDHVYAIVHENQSELYEKIENGKTVYTALVSGFTEGKNKVLFKAVDKVGKSVEVKYDVTVSLGAPVISITKAPKSSYYAKELLTGIEVSGTANCIQGTLSTEKNITAILSVKGKNGENVEWKNGKEPEVEVKANKGNWTVNVPTDELKNDGVYTYEIKISAWNSADVEGNGSFSFDVTVDTTKPEIKSAKIESVDAIKNGELISLGKKFDNKALDIEVKYFDSLSGISEVYAVLERDGNKKATKKAELDDNGIAKVTLSGFEEGENTVYFFATDKAGNRSNESKNINVVVDLGAPTVMFNAVKDAPVYGSQLKELGYTFSGKVSTPSKKLSETEPLTATLKITNKKDNSSATLKKDGENVSIKTELIRETGVWTYTIPSGCVINGDGEYKISLSVYAKNSAGTCSEIETEGFDIIIDTMPPRIKAMKLDGADINESKYYESSSIEVSVEVEKTGSDIDTVKTFVNGKEFNLNKKAEGVYSSTISAFEEGTNTICFEVTDVEKNTTEKVNAHTIKVNLGAPVVTIDVLKNAPKYGTDLAKGYEFTGKANTASKKFDAKEPFKAILKVTDSNGKTVNLKKDNVVLSVESKFNAATGEWSVTIPSGYKVEKDGTYTVQLTVSAKNSAGISGKEENVEFDFEVDTLAPKFVSATIAGKDIDTSVLHKESTLLVSAVYNDETGSGVASVKAYVNGKESVLNRSVNNENEYSAYVAGFVEGTNEIYFVAEDNIGNVSEHSKTFETRVTLNAPVVRITSKQKDSYFANKITEGIKVNGSVQNAVSMSAVLSVLDSKKNIVNTPEVAVEMSDKKDSWTVVIPNVPVEADGVYTYALTVNAKNSADVFGDGDTTTFEVIVDTKKPVFKSVKAIVNGNKEDAEKYVFDSRTVDLEIVFEDEVSGVTDVYVGTKDSAGNSLSLKKASIDESTKIATVSVNNLNEGINYIDFYAFDAAGLKSDTKNISVKVDLGKPTVTFDAIKDTSISSDIFNRNGFTFSGKASTPSKKFAKDALKAELEIVETISKKKVKLFDKNEEAVSLVPVFNADGTGTWTCKIPADSLLVLEEKVKDGKLNNKQIVDGIYKLELSIKAINSFGTESDVEKSFVEVVVDNQAPEFVSARVDEEKTNNAYTSSTLKVEVVYKDAISGVSKVSATLNGKKTDLLVKEIDGEKVFYNYIQGFDEGENTVTFMATDYAENTTKEAESLKVNVNLGLPVVVITTPADPEYVKKDTLSSGIKIEGTVSSPSGKPAKSVSAELTVEGKYGVTVEWDNESKLKPSIDVTTDGNTWSFIVPTDKLKNSGEYIYTFGIKATNSAGEEGNPTTTKFDFILDKEIPVVSYIKADSEVIYGKDKIDLTKKVFDSKSVEFEVKYTDNRDKIKNVSCVLIRDKVLVDTFKATIDENNVAYLTVNKLEEGKNNEIFFYAEDEVGNRSDDSSKFILNVNLGNPVVSIDPSKDSYIYSKNLEEKGLVITGKVSTASGKFAETPMIATISVENKDKDADNKVGKLVDSHGKEIVVTPVLEEKDGKYTGKWTCTIPKGTKISGDGKYTINLTVTCTNSFGATTTSEKVSVIDLFVDTKSPVFKSANVAGNAEWNSSSSLNVKAEYIDAVSDVKEVYYYVSSSNTKPADKTGFKLLNGGDATVNDFTNVNNYIYFYAKDYVGNESEITEGKLVKVDKATPSVNYTYYKASEELISASNTVLTNAEKNLVIYGTVSDADSGLKLLSFTQDNKDLPVTFSYSTTEVNPSNFNDVEFVSVPSKDTKSWKAEIEIKNIKNGVVRIKAEDNVSNVIEQQIFTLNVDTEGPSIVLTSPETKKYDEKGLASVINGNVVFTGNASDNYSLNSVSLSYSLDGENYESVGNPLKGSSAYSWTFEQNVSNIEASSKTIFDKKAEGTKNVYFKLDATDDAGNKTTNIYEYTVDPESDRPVITIMGIGLDKMNGASETKVNASLNTNTLSGTISDDDGIEKFEYSKDGKTYSTINVTNGAWNISVDDGTYTLYFRVTDKKNKKFTSNKDSYLSPILSDGSDSTKSKYVGKADTKLYIMVDKTAPEVKTPLSYSYDGKTFASDFSNGHFGGNNEKFSIKVNAKDANNIKGVTLNVEGIGNTYAKSYKATSSTAEAGYETWIVSGIDASKANVKTGKYKLTFTVEDNAGMRTVETESITVDNTEPTITPAKKEVGVTSTATINGEVNETVVISYGVSASESTAPAKYTTIEDASFAWYVYFDGGAGVGTHDYMFKNLLVDLGITTQTAIANGTYTTLTPVYVWVKAVDLCGNESIEKVKVIVDPQGDRPSVQVTYPEADNVTLGGTIRIMGTTEDNVGAQYVWIQIDSNGDDEFDLEDCKKFFKDGKALYDLINMKDGTEYASIDEIDEDDANNVAIRIPVNGSSWALSINEKGEFNSSNDTPNTIKLKIVATDDDKGDGSKINESFPVERVIKVDKNTPGFVQDSLKLVQYFDGNKVCVDGSVSDGTIARSIVYTEGLSVKGVWYLVGDITDDSGISKIAFKSNTVVENTATSKNTTYDNDGVVFEAYDDPVDTDGYYNYKMKIRVGDTEGVGISKFNIEAWEYKSDANAASVPKTFSIAYDNVAPTVANEKIGNSANSEFRISKSVANTDGFFSFGSTAYENTQGGVSQTGVAKVAFYITKGTDLYDVMLAKTDDANKVSISGKTKEDGLYWKNLTVSSVTDNAVTLSSDDDNIHAGGLVKINNVIYRITSKSSNVITLDGEPGNTKTAKYALANIVDNTTAEGQGSSKNENGYFTNGSYDDGDLMIESLVKQGTKAIWEASINSKNIPDGKAVLHYVVYDAAGNFNDQSYDIIVKNNQPRIAGVTVGTDYNGNGQVDSNEYVTSFSNYNPNGLAANGRDKVTEATIPSQVNGDRALLSIKGNTIVKPEIVGGNGTLGYEYKVYKKDETSSYVTQSLVSSGFGDGNEDSESVISGLNIELPVKTILEKGIEDGNFQKFEFIFWDSTGGKIANADNGSMSATLNLIMNVALRDSTPAQNRIRPFYWNSNEDNSLFNQSTKEGHIELPSDLTGTQILTNGGTGITDSDPKVSGRIKIEGYAHDNTLLKTLTIKFGSAPYSFATYSNGTWVQTNAITTTGGSSDSEVDDDEDVEVEEEEFIMPERGWASSISRVTYAEAKAAGFITSIPEGLDNALMPEVSEEYGHLVHWTIYYDTAVMENVGANKEITVSATDRGAASLVNDKTDSTKKVVGYSENTFAGSSTLQTGSGSKKDYTSYYKIDIVPYITEVKTKLSSENTSNPSVYNRTALGHYTVKDDETLYVKGFNIVRSGVNVYFGTETKALTVSNGYVQVPASKFSTSGELTLAVGSNKIKTLNNMNNDGAKGSYSKAITNASSYKIKNKYAYNRVPNNNNNNNLTDNVFVDVWKIDSTAARAADGSVITDPVMKINPKTGQLGFAFSAGKMMFSMANGTHSSYTRWMDSYEPMRSVGFTFDANGNSYGVVAGGDTNSTEADNFNFVTSRWGESGHGNNETTIDQDASYGSNYGDNNGKGPKNALSLEKIGQRNENGNGFMLDKDRIVSPSLSVSGNNVFLAYFDAINNEIRFRAGTLNNNYKSEFGTFYNDYPIRSVVTDHNIGNNKYNISHVNVPVSNTGTSLGNAKAGPSVSIAAINNTKVAMVWFDKVNNNLMFAVNKDPLNSKGSANVGKNLTNWAGVKTIRAGAGQYCQVVVDKNGGIHVAALESKDGSKGALVYAYAPPSTTNDYTFTSCVVDADGLVGYNLTIDVSMVGSNPVPRIGYYGMSSLLPKYAYLATPGTVTDGMKNNSFTGAWEVSYVPTTSDVPQDRINVAVYKNANGVAQNIPTGSKNNGTQSGSAYGNGTANAILAYQRRVSSTEGYIETAQLK